MSFANYTGLQAEIANWLARTDMTVHIPQFIAQAEASLNKVVRDRRMIASTTLSFASVARADLPDDLLDIVYVANNVAETETLTKKVPDWIAEQQRLRLKTAGTPLFYTIVGEEMIICPIPSSTKVYKLSYYQAIPALASNTTNWLLTHHPDLYLYTSLMHAYPFIKDEERANVMGNQMITMVQSLLKLNETTTLEGQAYDVTKA